MLRMIIGITAALCCGYHGCFGVVINSTPGQNLVSKVENMSFVLENIKKQLQFLSLEQEKQRSSYELFAKMLADNKRILEQTEIFHDSTLNKSSRRIIERTNALPSNCDEVIDIRKQNDGVYLLHMPEVMEKPFFAYCKKNTNTGEAWLIVQRRRIGNFDFHRSPSDYKHGFGNIGDDYWLGLEKLHAITNSKLHKLWIELQDSENATTHANFAVFAIDGEGSEYALRVLGEYTGTAGDFLRDFAGHKFSVSYDQYGRQQEGGCPFDGRSGWWLNESYCQECNLNGKYEHGLGVNCYRLDGRHSSFKYTHLAIRPAN